MPTVDLSSDIEAVKVPNASERTPPATGTAEPIINFAVFIERLSAEELTAVCIPKIPTNTVETNERTQNTVFLIPSPSPELFKRGETEEEILTAKYPLSKGNKT